VINEYAGDILQVENRYRSLTDDEILQLFIDGGLAPEAETVLKSEMRRRSLGTNDAKELKDWEQKKILESKPARQRVIFGYGVKFVGRKFLSDEDEHKGIFVATKFIVINYVPLVPIGSFRVLEANDGLPEIISKVPPQWNQVWPPIVLFLAAVFLGVGLAAVGILLSKHR
jgi:hypothetical protein